MFILVRENEKGKFLKSMGKQTFIYIFIRLDFLKVFLQ